MACIIFKNFIIKRKKDSKYEHDWLNLEVNFKSSMKEAIVATLEIASVDVHAPVLMLA